MNPPRWMDHVKTLPKGKYGTEIQRYLLLLLIPVVLIEFHRSLDMGYLE